ncbi:hypothetical protein CRG98_038951 [Punica granatum]|uniref:Retrotransposon Copia-like N-terminal domain-containing protein n=1 Tax=Punica granatum TaxID=22663 RepID=A0A2I0IBF3_PUNGR|nr:hypothetical protein CRG98_038951 [Punica granatum]
MEKWVETSGKGTGNVEVDWLSALTVNSSYYTGVSLINCKLTRSNYLTWSRAMLTALTTKNKVEMIDGTVARPPKGDPNRAKWEICNALVISWIFNRLDSELQSSVACATVAQDLWEDLRERYSLGNETRIYQLKAEIRKLKQDGMTIPKYYSRLKGLWDESDNYLKIPTCTCSTARTKLTGNKAEMQGSGGSSGYGGQIGEFLPVAPWLPGYLGFKEGKGKRRVCREEDWGDDGRATADGLGLEPIRWAASPSGVD